MQDKTTDKLNCTHNENQNIKMIYDMFPLELEGEWSLATFLNMGDAQPIKSAVRVVVGVGVGFSICARIVGTRGRHSMMIYC